MVKYMYFIILFEESATQWPYYVRRTRNHMMPVYMLTKAGGSQHITKIGKIDGDIWVCRLCFSYLPVIDNTLSHSHHSIMPNNGRLAST